MQNGQQKPAQVYLEGNVVDLIEETGQYQSKTVVVKEPMGQYPATIAFRFGGNNKGKADGVVVGDTVRCEGYAGTKYSEKSKRWFTDVRGVAMNVLRKAAPAERTPGADDGDDQPTF